MEKTEFIIVGDTEKHNECLICTCGTKERAEEVLDRLLHNPTKDDLWRMDGCSNLRIKEVISKNCWWNQGWLD